MSANLQWNCITKISFQNKIIKFLVNPVEQYLRWGHVDSRRGSTVGRHVLPRRDLVSFWATYCRMFSFVGKKKIPEKRATSWRPTCFTSVCFWIFTVPTFHKLSNSPHFKWRDKQRPCIISSSGSLSLLKRPWKINHVQQQEPTSSNSAVRRRQKSWLSQRLQKPQI